MTPAIFERLLYEEESTTLDFKRDQYPFVKASDDEKSELLKDILGFANAWRRSEAYILIGVEDVRGGRGNVVGIRHSDHLDDHSLQQFVNNLINRPLLFHYQAFGIEGKQVGIIRVEQQVRPVYLKRDYGKLQKEKVYVRRGSSTDPTKPASLDEVARMGHGSAAEQAELTVEFAAVGRDDSMGTSVAFQTEFCETPPREDIPDYGLGRRYAMLETSSLYHTNSGYYRQLAEYEFMKRLFLPMRVVVHNTGSVAATGVRVELATPAAQEISLFYPSDMPDRPRSREFSFLGPALRSIRPARREPGDVTIRKNQDRIRVEVECETLQPGRKVWSDVFYVGRATTGVVEFAGWVFAENLPQPKEFILSAAFTLSRTRLSVQDLRSLPDPGEGDED
ncbi:MAG TPA: ATP-binding protein [Gemmataceae bacterium]|nr:ATP-binding protein [Gemmataceae bacterium]